ncbi:MAG: hypothetical protein M3143_03245, partial [Actinomycetota bacterium]|nr:hypothetical protein [Actinomycetota bacterium]
VVTDQPGSGQGGDPIQHRLPHAEPWDLRDIAGIPAAGPTQAIQFGGRIGCQLRTLLPIGGPGQSSAAHHCWWRVSASRIVSSRVHREIHADTLMSCAAAAATASW